MRKLITLTLHLEFNLIMNKLEVLLKRNNIDTSNFQEVIYQNLKLSIFESIYNYLETESNKIKFKNNIRNSKNKILYVKKMILDICGCNLSNDECAEILMLLIAYFDKKETRIFYSKEVRKKLLSKQNSKCNICKIKVDLFTHELDHIIPWVYVGDEFPNNLQILCKKCNRKKGKQICFPLKMFLFDSERESTV